MDILDRLAKSKFRSRFKLRAKELEYIKEKGLNKIHSHACDFIRDRVALAVPVNDGKQTPMCDRFYCSTRNRYLLSWLHRKMAQIPSTQRTYPNRTRIPCLSNYGMDKSPNNINYSMLIAVIGIIS